MLYIGQHKDEDHQAQLAAFNHLDVYCIPLLLPLEFLL